MSHAKPNFSHQTEAHRAASAAGGSYFALARFGLRSWFSLLRSDMIRIVCMSVVVLCAATASAEQWAEKMFTQRSHDFGPVPRDSKTEYEFVVKNLYNEDLHIAHVGASCSCTQPRILKDTLKPLESGAIVAAFNTRAFSGQHSARLTVTIDRPQFAQVELQVKGYVRTDLVLEPGLVNLGTIGEGQAAEKKIKIEHFGGSDWKIKEVATDSEFLSASVNEKSRRGGRVVYELAVQLKEGAPAGYLKDQLAITTNDTRTKQFDVSVEGRIEPQLSVSPSTLMLGTLQPGQKITKNFVVKGIKPFKILDIHCDNASFTFKSSDESKTVHLIPMTFEAGTDAGTISQQIEIVTDLDDHKSVQLTVGGVVSLPLAGN